MPVYLATVRSYRSWREGDPDGFVQHDQGLQPPSPKLASWRDEIANQLPTHFSCDRFEMLLDVVTEIALEKAVRLHGCCVTSTHVHQIISFRQPECICRNVEHCHRDCRGRQHVELVLTRYKRIAGYRLAKAVGVGGRKWFSHGWNISPVRTPEHMAYLLETYLPKHKEEGGVVRIVC